MDWLHLLGPNAAPQPAEAPGGLRDCRITLAAYLPPDGGFSAGGCLDELLKLIDDPPHAAGHPASGAVITADLPDMPE